MRIAIIAASLFLAPAAYAQSNWIGNDQWNNANITAGSSTHIPSLSGNFVGGSSAGGNSIGVEVDGNLNFSNAQRFFGVSQAVTNVDIGELGGTATVQTRAFSNSAEVTAATACCLSINNFQAAQIDPTAVSNVSIGSATGDVAVGAIAFSNGLTATGSGYGNMSVNTRQMNAAATNALSSLSIGSAAGNVTNTAFAVGNNVTLSNVFKQD